METTVSATDLARTLGDVLGRVRYRHESFVVERNGTPVARIVPLGRRAATTVAEAMAAWFSSAAPDPTLARDLARIGAADRPPGNPWAS